MAEHVVNISGILYTIVRSSDVIEADGSTGRKFWQGHVVRSPNQRFHTCTSSWKETKGNKTSKVVWSAPYWAEPKNIGRANETTNQQQAYSEFESMVEQQRRKREATRPMPLLAKPFSDRKHKLTYPVYVQR